MRGGRRGLAELVAERAGIPQREALRQVRHVLDAMGEALANGDRLVIAELGSFRAVELETHTRVMPTTPPGEIRVPERIAIRFRPSRALKRRLQLRLSLERRKRS